MSGTENKFSLKKKDKFLKDEKKSEETSDDADETDETNIPMNPTYERSGERNETILTTAILMNTADSDKAEIPSTTPKPTQRQKIRLAPNQINAKNN